MLKDFIAEGRGRKFAPFKVSDELTVNIRQWSGTERIALSEWHRKHKDNVEKMHEFDARVLIQSLVDEDGNPEFTNKDIKIDIAAIQSEVDAQTLLILTKECLSRNGLGDEKRQEIEKN